MSLLSCCRRSSIMRRAWSIGMVVQSEVTSKDTMISSGSIVYWRMKVDNDYELLVCCPFCLPYGFSISAIYFDSS